MHKRHSCTREERWIQNVHPRSACRACGCQACLSAYLPRARPLATALSTLPPSTDKGRPARTAPPCGPSFR